MLYVPALAATAYATNTQLLRHPFPTLTLYLVVHDKEGLDETDGLGVAAISTSAITTSNSLEPGFVIDTVGGGLVKEPEKTDESTVIANLYSPHTGIPTMLGAAVEVTVMLSPGSRINEPEVNPRLVGMTSLVIEFAVK